MKRIFAIVTALTLIYLMTVVFSNSVMDDLSDNIIRLHIIANSDDIADQDIKLKVRDEILRADINMTDKASAIESMRMAEKTANKVLSGNGFSYGSKVDFGIFHFPQKTYDGITLPEGNYHSINVVLGDGKGKNWWCILSSPAYFSEGFVSFDDEPLKTRLKDETFYIITKSYSYKSKFLEFLKNFY